MYEFTKLKKIENKISSSKTLLDNFVNNFVPKKTAPEPEPAVSLSKKELVISKILSTPEGQAALAAAMVEPIKTSLMYQGIGKKLLQVDELPYPYNASSREDVFKEALDYIAIKTIEEIRELQDKQYMGYF